MASSNSSEPELSREEAYQLEYERTTKNDLGVDSISREQAKAAIRDKFKDLPSRVEINTILNELPSVNTQEPKTGHWIKGYTFPDGAYWKCDKCNELIKVKIPMRYCNNCGAKMESEDKE